MDATSSGNGTVSSDYDVVIVGGSLAGCTAAILLGQEGRRVAVVEKQPDPQGFKRMCSHFIQASGVPTIERIGLLGPIMDAGGVRSRIRAWTPWGRIDAPPETAGYAVNIRREILDPMLREAAAATPDVDLLLGQSAKALSHGPDGVNGVTIRDKDGAETTLGARLVVGADGRDSQIAAMSGVKEKVLPHGRFAYGSYFEGTPIDGAPDGMIWFSDPDWAAAFPTDSGLTFYAAMPTKDRLPEFKRNPEEALISYMADLPEPPPIHEQHRVEDVIGKIEMPNRIRTQTAPGLALVGDAALATDPLFGVGCGWAFQSGEWLADSVAPALNGEESLDRGLKRYRRAHSRHLRFHGKMIHDYSTGRTVNGGEKMLFRAAGRDPKLAARFDAYATRRIGPTRMFVTTIPRAMFVNARHAVGGRGKEESPSEIAAA